MKNKLLPTSLYNNSVRFFSIFSPDFTVGSLSPKTFIAMILCRAGGILTLSLQKLIFIFLVSTSTAFAQGDCGNIGFEEGTTNGWTCKYGTYGGTLTSGKCSEQVFSLSLPMLVV